MTRKIAPFPDGSRRRPPAAAASAAVSTIARMAMNGSSCSRRDRGHRRTLHVHRRRAAARNAAALPALSTIAVLAGEDVAALHAARPIDGGAQELAPMMVGAQRRAAARRRSARHADGSLGQLRIEAASHSPADQSSRPGLDGLRAAAAAAGQPMPLTADQDPASDLEQAICTSSRSANVRASTVSAANDPAALNS